MSFKSYCKSNSKHWKLLSKKSKTSLQESNVSIIISLYDRSEKKDKLKPTRGKRISLKAHPQIHILEKVAAKQRNFHRDSFNEEDIVEMGKRLCFYQEEIRKFLPWKYIAKKLEKKCSKTILYQCTILKKYSEGRKRIINSDDNLAYRWEVSMLLKFSMPVTSELII